MVTKGMARMSSRSSKTVSGISGINSSASFRTSAGQTLGKSCERMAMSTSIPGARCSPITSMISPEAGLYLVGGDTMRTTTIWPCLALERLLRPSIKTLCVKRLLSGSTKATFWPRL